MSAANATRRASIALAAGLLALAACGAPLRPAAVSSPTPDTRAAVLRELLGGAQLQSGSDRRAARPGDAVAPSDTLLLGSGTSALVALPGDAATVQLTPVTRRDPAGRVEVTTFRFTGTRDASPGVVVNGAATISVADRVALTALCGAAVVRTTGPSTFTVGVAAGSYGDATIRVSAGTVTASSQEGGTPLTLSAGQEGTVRLPRGH